MALYLFETSFLEEDQQKDTLKEKINEVEVLLENEQATLIEVQVAKDLSQAFFIIETNDEKRIQEQLAVQAITVQLTKEVRLLGEDLEDVKRQAEKVNYVVEWNLPENLTMDQYLNRKEKNSVHYADVPEVSFARTYVCEDMTKCLCFYDAPNEQIVERAREAVQAPIDVLTELDSEK